MSLFPLPVLQVLCVEREINRLNEVHQQLSSELHRAMLIHSPPERKESKFDKPLQVTASGDPDNPHNVGGSAKCIYIVTCISHFCLSLTLPMLSGATDNAGAAEVSGGSEAEGDERQTF